jgi:STE24 endopeptidase
MRNEKSKKYNQIKLTLSVIENVLEFFLILIILLAGFSQRLDSVARHLFANDYLSLFFFTLLLGTIASALTFPLSFYREFTLEHRYGLSNQSLGSYFWEKTKGLFIALPLLLILLGIFFFLLKRFPDDWWLIMGTVIVMFSVILSRLAPTLIFPLFYKFEALDNVELKENIEKLCRASGMKLEGLYKFNMSKNTKKANAAFTGIGKSRRIILGDTLLEKLSQQEILAVLAHELGHFRLKHIWKGMALGIFLNYLGLFLVDYVYSETFHHFGASKHALSALPLMALLLTLFYVITGPVSNIYSRKHEREADDYSAKLMNSTAPLKTGLQKLTMQNLGDEAPHPVVEFLFYSHPSTRKRIDRLSALDEQGL